MRLGTGGGKQIGRTSQLEGGIRKKMAQERVGDAGGGGAGVSADDDDLGPCRMSPIPGSQRAERSIVKYRYQIERPRCDPAPETSLFCPQ